MSAALSLHRLELWPLLALAPAAWLLLRWRARVRREVLRACVGPRVADLAKMPLRRRRRVRRVVFCTGLLLAVVAALGPALGAAAGVMEWGGVDLVVCLDVSRSMRARDQAPDRLARAQEALRTLSERVRGDRLALVVFSGEARLLAPLTRDAASVAHLASLANPASVRRGGTDLGAALDAARRALRESSTRPRAVVLLTDGEDLEGRGARAARLCAQAGIRVHGVGFGSALGSKIATGQGRTTGFLTDRAGRDVVSALDAAGLALLAQATGGAFVAAQDVEHPLADLYARHVLPTARADLAQRGGGRRSDRFQWPLLVAVLLFLLDVALVDRRRR